MADNNDGEQPQHTYTEEELKEAQVETLARLVFDKALRKNLQWWRIVRVVVPIVSTILAGLGIYVISDLKGDYNSLKKEADSLETSLKELQGSVGFLVEGAVDQALESTKSKVDTLGLQAKQAEQSFAATAKQTRENIKEISRLQLDQFSTAQKTLIGQLTEIITLYEKTKTQVEKLDSLEQKLQEEISISQAFRDSVSQTIELSMTDLRERVSDIERCRTYAVTEIKEDRKEVEKRILIADRFGIVIEIGWIDRDPKKRPPVQNMFAYPSPTTRDADKTPIDCPTCEGKYNIDNRWFSIQVVNVVDLPDTHNDFAEVEICDIPSDF